MHFIIIIMILKKVERCLREGETCNIASAGYDSTVCRCIIFFSLQLEQVHNCII